MVDRMSEGLPGFEALVSHETLHVHERHALIGFVLFLLVLPLWPFWRREQEVRADAFALLSVEWTKRKETDTAPTIDSLDRSLCEFRSFVLMHDHPTGRFWRWVYGWSVEHRVTRAIERARRYGWKPA
jgi:hypothetical protein